MDHLPSSFRPYPHVPFLGVVGDHSFSRFPENYGLTLKQLKKGQYDGKSLNDLAPMLQGWLFFGLLNEIIKAADLEFKKTDFIDGTGEHPIVTTEKLRDLIIQWHCQEWAADDDEAEVNLKHIIDCLKTAKSVTNALVKHFRDESFSINPETGEDQMMNEWSQPGNLVLVSIIILGESLDQAKKYVYGKKGERVRDLNELSGSRNKVWAVIAQITETWKAPFYVKMLLMQSGWCSHEIDTLKKTIDESRVTVLYYLSFLDRRPILPSGKDHSACTKQECIVNNVDRKTYKTRHTDKCHGTTEACEFIHLGAAEKEMLEIIRSGGVPLVQISGRGGSTSITLSRSHIDKSPLKQVGYLGKKAMSSALKFIPSHRPVVAEPTATYVAISHVWGHGLGNPHSNSLPACQLHRLQQISNELYGDLTMNMPFWIDTLCVPIPRSFNLSRERLSHGAASDEQQKVEDDAAKADALKTERPKNPVKGDRNDAIAAMAKIYRNADKVVVIDRSLQLCTDVASPYIQNPERYLISIQCSTWAQRLWTYQESFLTKNCWFRFADRALQIDQLIAAYKTKKDDELESIYKITTAEVNNGSKRHRRVEKVFEQRRSGMGLADFGIIASNIRVMGIDLSPSLASDVVRGDQLLCRHIARGLVDPVFRAGAEFSQDLIYKQPRIREHRVKVLAPILSALGWRQTTATKDEPVCIGSMMGLNVAKILTYETGEERMVELLNQLQYVPKTLLFSSLPSLGVPGYRWAPNSYLNSRTDDSMLQAFQEDKLCQVTTQGLRIRSPTLQVTFGSQPPPDDVLYLDAGSGRIVEVSFRSSRRDGTDHSWADYRDRKLYILLRYALKIRLSDDAVLVILTDQKDDARYGDYQAALSVTLLDKKDKIDAQEGEIGMAKKVKDESIDQKSHGDERREEPLWCIG